MLSVNYNSPEIKYQEEVKHLYPEKSISQFLSSMETISLISSIAIERFVEDSENLPPSVINAKANYVNGRSIFTPEAR